MSNREKDLGFGWKVRVGARRLGLREGIMVLRREMKEEGDGDLRRVREMSIVRKEEGSGVGMSSSWMRVKRSTEDGDGMETCSVVRMRLKGGWEDERWMAKMLCGYGVGCLSEFCV